MSLQLMAGGAAAAYVLYCPLLALSQKDAPEYSADYNYVYMLLPSLAKSSYAGIDSQNLAAVLATGLVAGAGARYMGYI